MRLPVKEYSAEIRRRNPRDHICVVDTSIFSYEVGELEFFLSTHDCIITPQVLNEIRHVPRHRLAERRLKSIASDLDLLQAALLLMQAPKATIHARIAPLLGLAIEQRLTEDEFDTPAMRESHYYVTRLAEEGVPWQERVRMAKAHMDKRFAVSPADTSVVATGLALARDYPTVVCADDKDIKYAVQQVRKHVPKWIWYAPSVVNHQ